MNKISDSDDDHHHIRKKNPEVSLKTLPNITGNPDEKNLNEIIRKLQVYQAELLIQNEELTIAHQELETSRDKYQKLYDSAPVGYVTLSSESLIIQINRTGSLMLGITQLSEKIFRFRRFIAPEHQDMWDRFFFQILQTDKKYSTNILMLPSNHEVIATRIEGIRVLSENGSFIVHLVISDISDIRRTEMALQESEERFHMLFQNIPSISVQGYNSNGITRYWNAASEKLYGYSADEAIGRSLLDLIIPPEMRPDVERAIACMAETGEPIPAAELSLMRKDGSRVPVFSSHTILYRSGYEPELFCIDIDLSELRKTEEVLREANKKIKLLSSLTRHDIVNHISALNMTLEMIEHESDLEKIRKNVSSSLGVCNRMEAIIGFTREYENFGEVSSGWQLVCPIIHSAISEQNVDEVRIDNRIPEDLRIYAEPILRKVFATLIENSIRHGGNISKISFSIQEGTGCLFILYEDDGVGIPAEKKELIFEHGYGSHTGIGLFLSREILSITGLTIHECGIENSGVKFEIGIPEGKYTFNSLSS